jgi:hypothetical protein
MHKRPDPHEKFWELFNRKAGIGPIPGQRTIPGTTAADGAEEEPLPNTIPED